MPRQMEEAGYAPEEIERLLPAYMAAGWTASQASYPPAAIVSSLAGEREDGTAAQEASAKGYTPSQMEQAGYAPQEVGAVLADKRAGGMTAGQASAAGYSPAVLRAAGYTPEEVGGVLAAQKAGG